MDTHKLYLVVSAVSPDGPALMSQDGFHVPVSVDTLCI